MKTTLNEIDIDSLAPLTRRPNNYDDYQISFYWVKSVLAMLATATQGTVLSYASVESFDENVAKAIRSELQVLAWMSLASINDDTVSVVESTRLKWVVEQVSKPLVLDGQFPFVKRRDFIEYLGSAHTDMLSLSDELLATVKERYLLYPMLHKALFELIQIQNRCALYPILREQIKALLLQRVELLTKQGL
jgi:hypothetical protein